MARGRFLNTSIADDVALNSLSIESQWLYMMTIPHLDRDGLIKADTYVLFGKVCPRRPELITLIDGLINEWVVAKLVITYPTRDGRVAFFKGFTKNQQGMHYAREGASTLEVPPGYKRANTGIEPIQDVDGDDDGGVTSCDKPTPDPFPTNSRLTPAEVKYKDQYEDQGGEYASATETPLVPTPPSYRPLQASDEYIPGVGMPRHRQDKRNCDHFMAQASKHGVGAEPFRLMVDAILDATGKTSLANTNGNRGQEMLNQGKETVVTLLEMGRHTIEDIRAVLTSWRENDWRGKSPPTFAQIVEHASAMDAGTHITARRQSSEKKEFSSFNDYNEWAERNDPEYKRIREGVLIRGNLIKRQNYRPHPVH